MAQGLGPGQQVVVGGLAGVAVAGILVPLTIQRCARTSAATRGTRKPLQELIKSVTNAAWSANHSLPPGAETHCACSCQCRTIGARNYRDRYQSTCDRGSQPSRAFR